MWRGSNGLEGWNSNGLVCRIGLVWGWMRDEGADGEGSRVEEGGGKNLL